MGGGDTSAAGGDRGGGGTRQILLKIDTTACLKRVERREAFAGRLSVVGEKGREYKAQGWGGEAFERKR